MSNNLPESNHENPQLKEVLHTLTWRVMQQQAGNLDEVNNREDLNHFHKEDEPIIIQSDLFKDTIIPALKDAYARKMPYQVIVYYKDEDPSAPFDGFILKAPVGSNLTDIAVNLEEDLDAIYDTTPSIDDASLEREEQKIIDTGLKNLESKSARVQVDQIQEERNALNAQTDQLFLDLAVKIPALEKTFPAIYGTKGQGLHHYIRLYLDNGGAHDVDALSSHLQRVNELRNKPATREEMRLEEINTKYGDEGIKDLATLDFFVSEHREPTKEELEAMLAKFKNGLIED